MSKKILFIEGRREGYAIDQISNTFTVGEMIEALSHLDEDTEIYLDNDNGYTYGSITDWSMNVKCRVVCPECGEEFIWGEDGDENGEFECYCGENLYHLIELQLDFRGLGN